MKDMQMSHVDKVLVEQSNTGTVRYSQSMAGLSLSTRSLVSKIFSSEVDILLYLPNTHYKFLLFTYLTLMFHIWQVNQLISQLV